MGCGVLFNFASIVECGDIFFLEGSCYSCVGPLVCRQGIFSGEPLVTIRAHMWPLTCVGQGLSLHVTFLIESFVTLRAGEWLVSSVG